MRILIKRVLSLLLIVVLISVQYIPGFASDVETAEIPVVQHLLRGDVNNDGQVNSNDAITLLRHTMNPARYPISQSGDMNGDGKVDSNDAIYLLRYTMNGDRYPLYDDETSSSSPIFYQIHSYLAFDAPNLTWTDAKEYCESLGGHLVTISSQEEQVVVSDLIKDRTSLQYWLGASDAEQEGIWKWITGDVWSYTNWDVGQPDDSGNEDYLQIFRIANPQSSDSTPYTWNDINVENSYPYALDFSSPEYVGFICEWEYDITGYFGKCGDSLYWLFRDNGTLVIFGTGEMWDFDYNHNRVPWEAFKSEITNLDMKPGITYIGYAAFASDIKLLGDITIPDTVREIGEWAFNGIAFSGNLTLSENLETIRGGAFDKSMNDKRCELLLPDSLKLIGDYAFYGCSYLTGTLSIPSSVKSIGIEAFSYCREIITPYFYGNAPSVKLGQNYAGEWEGIFGTRDSSFKIYHLADKEGWPPEGAVWNGYTTAIFTPD